MAWCQEGQRGTERGFVGSRSREGSQGGQVSVGRWSL